MASNTQKDFYLYSSVPQYK